MRSLYIFPAFACLALVFYESLHSQSAAPAQFSPSALISKESIRELELQYQAQAPNYQQIQARVTSLLENYYSSLPNDNPIAQERQLLEQELQRMYERKLSFASAHQPKAQFLQESPYLFRLHVLAAKCLAALDQPRKSLAQYLMAFRYAAIAPPLLEERAQLQPFRSESWLPKGRRRELSEEASLAEKEERYQWMRRYFASNEGIAQEWNPQIQAAAQIFQAELKRYFALKKAYLQAAGQVDIALAKMARGEDAALDTLRAQKREAQASWEDALKKLEAIRQGQYREYYNNRRELQGDAAYRMALQARRLAIEDRAFAAKSEGLAYLAGHPKGAVLPAKRARPSLHMYSYIFFLELAHKIHPLQPFYIALLSDAYQEASELKKAVFFKRLYLRHALAQAGEKPPAAVSKQYLRLAGLYIEQNNYAKAAESYETFLQTAPAQEQTAAIVKALADLHYHKSGKWQRAKELYHSYLEKEPAAQIQGFSQDKEAARKALVIAKRYESLQRLAHISQKEQEEEAARQYLILARKEFGAVEALIALIEKEWKQLQAQRHELKGQLRKQQDLIKQNAYFRLRNLEIPQKKALLDSLLLRKEAMNYPHVLEKLAQIAKKNRDFEEARQLYEEIVQRGRQEQIARAYQELRNIAKVFPLQNTR